MTRNEAGPAARPGAPPFSRGRRSGTSSASRKARGRHAARAEAALALSVGLGLRAKELAGLTWADVYETDGRVRKVVHLKAAYTKGGRTRDVFVVVAVAAARRSSATARRAGCSARGRRRRRCSRARRAGR